ncbi:DUF6049 family protein [Brachybacterium sp. AOP43-C2-M15]|uniref:DUF6049 family protein n=1 Tax=Brachybacterium sp. AOP43-C2-M15 TaxID=3457661 RepID=UPI0040333ADE
MPSSPPSVRPVLAALLTALVMASSVLVSGPATLVPAARADGGAVPAGAPAAPPETPDDAPVSMDLVSLTPTSLAPGGTLEAQLEVTNTSSEPLSALALELRTRTARVTDRSVLADWQSDTTPTSAGAALESSEVQEELAPGESAVLTVRVDAEELDYSEEPYYWGTRRLALTVVSEEEPLATLRTFVVWRPDDVDETITQSVLLPLAADDASAVATDPEGFAESSESGRLAAVRELAPREDVDWWLDPALLDPPLMPVPLPDGVTEPDEDDEDAPQPVREYAPDATSAELADLLDESVGDRTVLSMPYAQADTVSLDRAEAEDLAGVVRDRGNQAWSDLGISPRGAAQEIEGPAAEAPAFEDVLRSGGSTAIVPSSSLRPDPAADVTPSSVGVYSSTESEGSQLALLAPDPELSAEFSLLTGDSDTEQTQQRLLAETATIASEYTTAPRHMLISPSPETVLDPEAAGAALDALGEAPWIVDGRTSALLDAADHQQWTSDPRSDGEELFALGRITAGDVHPSAGGQDGRWEHLDEVRRPELLAPESLSALEDSWRQVDTLSAAMEVDSPLDAPRLEILTGTSLRWRGLPEVPAGRAQETADLTAELRSRIQVVPASGYNVISDAVSVPITINNDLDTPIRVRIAVTSDKPLVRIGDPTVVEVPARGQIDASVDVEAIANGSVTLTTVVSTEDGRSLTDPVDVPLTVNPSWENWTTLVLVIAMGLLVVVGVARARRVGSSTRAPAIHGPEDPEELARTGRSTLDTRAAEGVWAERSAAEPEADHGAEPSPDPSPDPSSEPSPDPETETDPPSDTAAPDTTGPDTTEEERR